MAGYFGFLKLAYIKLAFLDDFLAG